MSVLRIRITKGRKVADEKKCLLPRKNIYEYTQGQKQPQCFLEEGGDKSWPLCSVDQAAVKMIRVEDLVAKQLVY